MFSNSELVPDMYKASASGVEKAIANCMIAIDVAMRTGASPLMIMQNMVIIYGRPSWSSKFLVASVNTCGRFNQLQYRFTEKGMLGKVDYIEYKTTYDGGRKRSVAETKTFDGTKTMNIECVAFTTVKGSDKVLESSPISIHMAVQEGWYTKSGSKWTTMPKQMLMYRAASFWTNAYAPEISMGMKTDDEMHDIIDVEAEVITDVSEKVEREVATNANKTRIGLNDAPKTEPQPVVAPVTPMPEPTAAPPVKTETSDNNQTLFKNSGNPGF